MDYLLSWTNGTVLNGERNTLEKKRDKERERVRKSWKRKTDVLKTAEQKDDCLEIDLPTKFVLTHWICRHD